MTKPPAFQFYARDFYMGSASMTAASVGAYIRSLAWSWDNGPLPADHATWAKLVFLTSAEFKRIWPSLKLKFKKVKGGYVNDRLERQRREYDAYRAMCAENGAKGGRPRKPETNPPLKPRVIKTKPEAKAETNPEKTTPSSSPSPEDQDPKDQNPRENALRSRPWKELRTLVSVRKHLRRACHELIESGDPQYRHDCPHQLFNLSDALKILASRNFQVVDYDGRSIDKIVQAVLGVRASRMAVAS